MHPGISDGTLRPLRISRASDYEIHLGSIIKPVSSVQPLLKIQKGELSVMS
jgi:hypothetical protein